MLPRNKYRRLVCLSIATTFAASTLISTPAQATSSYTPPVTVNELEVKPSVGMSALSVGPRTITLLPAQVVSPFTLVGLTWVGPVSIGTEFKVRVRESGVWSAWFELEYGEYQGVGKDGSESVDTRVGSDPLLTGLADGVEVIMESSTGVVPSQMKVTLVNSQVTKQDQSIGQQSMRMATADTGMQSQAVTALVGAAISPQGALVARPRIVSRAEWGADETWRNPVPRVGTTLLAGIVHHTASTNNYTAEQAPAQMRNLYAYFTQSLNYADMGYNFLVDKYGTIYEGRSGCAVGAVDCDSATIPVQGAHAAGLNAGTFGVSAIGNYDVSEPENPGAIVESIASLMAWKLAPYGLDPNATAYILSTDTSGSSKFSAGQTAITQVISAHRDVGWTVCPGRYLHPYMGAIRARATTLLAPVIQGVTVTPTFVASEGTDSVNVSAIIPANATWSVGVKNAESGLSVKSVSGTQTISGPMTFAWDRKDDAGELVPLGRYEVSVNASVSGVTLPPTTNVVSIVLAANLPPTTNVVPVVAPVVAPIAAPIAAPVVSRAKPTAVTAIRFHQLSRNRVKVSWSPAPTRFASTGYYYRVSKSGGKYGKWTKSSGMKTAVTISNWKKKKTYKIQVKVRNTYGYSPTVTYSFKTR
jgi:hypothetical protein